MVGIVLDVADGDILVNPSGECVIDTTEQQSIEHVILAMRGEFKEYPLLGGELPKLQHGCGSRLWCARARIMCEAVGISVSRIYESEPGKIVVER